MYVCVCVQRRGISYLLPLLPPKFEYSVFVRLSPLQEQLYSLYLHLYPPPSTRSQKESDVNSSVSHSVTVSDERDPSKPDARDVADPPNNNQNMRLFADFQSFLLICCHPYALPLSFGKRNSKV